MAIDTFLKTTGQVVTFSIGVAVQVLGAVLVLLALTPVGTSGTVTTFAVLSLGGITLALGGFAWNCLRIRCPNCGSRVFWEATRHESPSSWFSGAVGPSCPKCGYSPPRTAASRDPSSK